MASVNSRAELFPNRAYSPTGSDDLMMDEDPEFQATMPLKLRHNSSYENMNGRSFTDDHQYEDPAKLKDEVFQKQSRGKPLPPSRSGKRKKVNEIYEPVNTNQRKRTFTDESDTCDGYHRDTCSKCFKIMAFVGCLLALAASAVLIMLMVGVLSTPSCRDCKKELVPGQASAAQATGSTKGSTEELWNVIKILKSNVSKLNAAVKMKDEVISQLQKRDLEHTGKIAELEKKAKDFNNKTFNVSEFVGPRGPPGIDGPAGPKGEDGVDGKAGKPGPGNMTLCRYESRQSAPFTADISGGSNVVVTEEPGERITGVTCSTLGTSEYNFRSGVNVANKRQYQCQCRGRSLVFRAAAGKALCILHYWTCPLIS